MKKFFAILTLAAFTMGLSFAQTTPPADKKETTEKHKKKKKTTTTDSTAPADKSAPKK